MIRIRPLALVALTLPFAACRMSHEAVRADSVQTAEQVKLSTQLAAQKDSLMTVVLDADRFISRIDSQISRVRGLPEPRRKKDSESPIQDQLQARRDLLVRVDALVKRTQTTARQLAESRGHVKQLLGDSARAAESLASDERMIADLNETIQRQTTRVAGLQSQVDSLTGANARLGAEVVSLNTAHAKVFYIVGREDELLKKGVIVREGGANLLVAHPGRTLQPARALDSQMFTPIDLRSVHEIPMPDSTRRYAIVSRQNVDQAEISQHDDPSFRGSLRIRDADRFWAPSRYLIIVER